MSNLKEIFKSILTSHITWALLSFLSVVILTGMNPAGHYSKSGFILLISSCILFVLFSLGAVGLSIFNLIAILISKLFKKK